MCLVYVSRLDLALYADGRDAYNAVMLEKGLVQIYTGNGKGKTTAAFGLALRAAGQGNKILIYQFLKPPTLDAGERLALASGTASITVETVDIPWDMSRSLEDENDVAAVKTAISEILERLVEMAENRPYDVLILDEIVFCLSKGLAKLEDLKNLIDRRDPAVEIVLTGRGATAELIELADLVTEMKNVKHPFDKGEPARRGIEY
jgi:cob(I)alamin adenosyltransferase